MAESVTQILNSGPVGSKRNIAVLGDGFTEADFDAYNAKVEELLINGVFAHDYFLEDKSGFNIFRVNLISAVSGISTRKWMKDPDDPEGKREIPDPERENMLDTALKYIFTEQWSHCWMEGSASTGQLQQAALEKWVPDYNLVLVILNTTGFGGCGGNSNQVVTMGGDWMLVAHEFGHGAASLGDEYCGRTDEYDGSESWRTNITSEKERIALKWRAFVSPDTPIPSGLGACAGFTEGKAPAGWTDAEDVGLFEGAATYDRAVYRPALICRMRDQSLGRPYCPVCYTEMKRRNRKFAQQPFWWLTMGDFNGGGKDDILHHWGTNISIYRSTGNALEVVSTASERVPGSWQFQPGDAFLAGDFDGDGADEVVVYNLYNWNTPYLGLLEGDGAGGLRLIARYDGFLPGWQMGRHDRIFAGDFDGDGKTDLFVFNGEDWAHRWFGMFRSTGTGFELVARYKDSLAGWAMGPHDRHMVADFDGDGKADIYIYNNQDWDRAWFGMMHSSGSGISPVKFYDRYLPWYPMSPHDRYYAADFNGDGRDDLYVVNTEDFDKSVIMMIASKGNELDAVSVATGAVPGWAIRKNDSYRVADVDGTGREGFVVVNREDWAQPYIGVISSDGTELSGRAHGEVGEWDIGTGDTFKVCNYSGGKGTPNVILHNGEWLGLARLSSPMGLDRRYFQWVHNYRHGQNW